VSTPSYYPPRAPWYRAFREAGYGLLAATRLNRFTPPGGMALSRFVMGLLVPGHAFGATGNPVGRWMTAGWFGLLIACLFGLGHGWSNLGFGLLVSIHASGVLYLAAPWLAGCRLPFRLAIGVMTVGVLILTVYLPLQGWLQRNVCRPLRVEGRVVVVRPGGDPARVRRGDRVAYQLSGATQAGVVLPAGIGFGAVLAVGGDQVEFTPQEVKVNGRGHPRQRWMPVEGEVPVPEGCWFIWPRVEPRVVGAVSDATIENVLFSSSLVWQDAFVGRPYRRWLLRKQHLP
jgi:hypothetical protein